MYLTELMHAKDVRVTNSEVNVKSQAEKSEHFKDLQMIIDWATSDGQNGPSEGITPLSKKKFEIMISEIEALIEMMQPNDSKQKSLNFYTKSRQN